MNELQILEQAESLKLETIKKRALGADPRDIAVGFHKSAMLYASIYQIKPEDHLLAFEACGLFIESKDPILAIEYYKIISNHRLFYRKEHLRILSDSFNRLISEFKVCNDLLIRKLREVDNDIPKLEENLVVDLIHRLPGTYFFYWIAYRISEHQKRYNDALNYINRAIDLSWENFRMISMKMLMHYNLGIDKEDIERMYAKFKTLSPEVVYIYTGLKIRDLKGKSVYKKDLSEILDLIDEAHRLAVSKDSYLVKYTSGMKEFVVNKIFPKINVSPNVEDSPIDELESLFEIGIGQIKNEERPVFA